jgi:gag-polyprotein putative aspartyl protease
MARGTRRAARVRPAAVATLSFVHKIPMLIHPDPDDPNCADIMVDAVIAGRPYSLRLDTGAARTQLLADSHLAELATLGRDTSAGAFGQPHDRDIITIGDLTIGDLDVPPLDVVRVDAPGQQSLLGLDVLRQHRCQFRFDDEMLVLDGPRMPRASLDLQLDDRGHVYIELGWDDATASACWDSGAGITVVDRAFRLRHPELFSDAGRAAGTDSTGAQFAAPTFTMAGPHIAGVGFPPSKVAVIDLSPLNRELEFPMDLIAGYPMLRQARWLFDFPVRRWAAPELISG